MLTPMCSIEETIDKTKRVDPSEGSHLISFAGSATKATIADLSTMQGDANGFRVYATSGNSPTGWYKDVNNRRINGTNNHSYQGGKWSFTPDIYWPFVALDYPMKFWALYPASPAGLGSVDSTFTPTFTLSASYTVQSVNNQIDLLAGRASATDQPIDGVCPIQFDHILSMVDFGIVAGVGTAPHVQSIEVVNVRDTRTFDFVSWDWQSSPTTGNANYPYYSAVGNMIWPAGNPITADELFSNPIYVDVVAANRHLMLMPQTSPAWRPNALTGGMVVLHYRMETGIGTTGVGTPREVGFPNASAHPDNASGTVTGPLFVKAGFPFSIASSSFTWEKGFAYHYKIGLGIPGSCNGYILDEYYYDDQGVKTNLKLIEIIKDGKQLYHKLQDGEIHVMLDVYKWEEYVQPTHPPGGVQVTPRTVTLPYQAQTPASQVLTVVCRDGQGNFDSTMPWALSVNTLGPSWLRLALNPDGTNPGGLPITTTVLGVGPMNVYLVADANIGSAGRSYDLSLNGGLSIASTITQEPFPGPGFSGWLYVKSGSTGTGLSWSNAMPTITEAIALAQWIQGAPYNYVVKGILVAGGENAYPESFAVPANVRLFGGWAGTPGTELTSSDPMSAPYTSSHRNLEKYKAIVTRNVGVSGSNAVLDGFIIKYVTGNVHALSALNGAYINAVEIINNTFSGSSVSSLLMNNAKATNILVADNNRGISIENGSVVVNATIANNSEASTLANSSLLNSVVWNSAFSFSGSNTVQYCAFPDGSPAIGLDPNNVVINTVNTAWFTPGNVVPGPHFSLSSDPNKAPYMALNNRAPMLGRGSQSIFDNETLLEIPAGHKKDINGNPRHVMGTDMGCYEDGVLEGFKLQWATDVVYISPKVGYYGDIPLLLPGNEGMNEVGVDWNVSVVSPPGLTYCQLVDKSTNTSITSDSGSGTGVMVGSVRINPTVANTSTTPINGRLCGSLLVQTNLGNYLPDATFQVFQTPAIGVWSDGFVGSFHKNGETEERLIKGTNSGAWTARIINGLDWIMIDNNPDGFNGGKVIETFGGAISGTGNIVFRIGLKSTLPPGAPPRYGLILVIRSSGAAMLFVRQGEEADYLYGPSDPRPGGARTEAIKFSPYNLTDEQGRFSATGTDLGTRGGRFVQYPSQTGYFFKWNGTVAYYPDNSMGTVTHGSSYKSGNWDPDLEPCPPGYYTPTDPQWVHSFFLDRNPGSSGSGSAVGTTFCWGRYADGYFDKYAAMGATTYGTGPGRATNGLLMYNDFSNASVFFPIASYRNGNTNGFTYGTSSYQWIQTSSPRASDTMWHTHNQSGHLGMSCTTAYRYEGLNVRCVVVPPIIN